MHFIRTGTSTILPDDLEALMNITGSGERRFLKVKALVIVGDAKLSPKQ